MLRVWWICLSKHETFYDLFPRTYWKWVLVNLIEFGLFAGAATACLWIVACWAQAKLCLGTGCDRRSRRSPAAPSAPAAMCMAGLGVLLLLDVSGKNLSEVARLWMFLMPLAAVGGGVVLSRWGAGGYLPWLVVAAQGVQVIIFKLRLDVFSIY